MVMEMAAVEEVEVAMEEVAVAEGEEEEAVVEGGAIWGNISNSYMA